RHSRSDRQPFELLHAPPIPIDRGESATDASWALPGPQEAPECVMGYEQSGWCEVASRGRAGKATRAFPASGDVAEASHRTIKSCRLPRGRILVNTCRLAGLRGEADSAAAVCREIHQPGHPLRPLRLPPLRHYVSA